MERETRFTAEVLDAAARRFRRLVEETGSVPAVAEELSWSTLGTAELADEEYDRVCLLVPSGYGQVTEAFRDGLLIGALAADIALERSFGITEEAPC